ncbi:hypothetical protein Tco_0478845, partial [Tanacetum coccineum]
MWCSLGIQSCLRSLREVSININGSPTTGQFHLHGLKQDDPVILLLVHMNNGKFAFIVSKNGDVQEEWSLVIMGKNVLASKEKGGLGVSSLYALNRGLMFKWVWRFFTQNTSLWSRVIKATWRRIGKWEASEVYFPFVLDGTYVHEIYVLEDIRSEYEALFGSGPDVNLVPVSDRWKWSWKNSVNVHGGTVKNDSLRSVQISVELWIENLLRVLFVDNEALKGDGFLEDIVSRSFIGVIIDVKPRTKVVKDYMQKLVQKIGHRVMNADRSVRIEDVLRRSNDERRRITVNIISWLFLLVGVCILIFLVGAYVLLSDPFRPRIYDYAPSKCENDPCAQFCLDHTPPKGAILDSRCCGTLSGPSRGFRMEVVKDYMQKLVQKIGHRVMNADRSVRIEDVLRRSNDERRRITVNIISWLFLLVGVCILIFL